MIYNKKLEKQLRFAVIATVLSVLLFCALCAVCLMVADDTSPALRLCLVLAMPFAVLVGALCCGQYLKTVFKIQINDTDIVFKSLLRETTVAKPHSVAIEINFGKIVLHSDDEGANRRFNLYSFSGGAEKIQTPLEELKNLLRANGIIYRET